VLGYLGTWDTVKLALTNHPVHNWTKYRARINLCKVAYDSVRLLLARATAAGWYVIGLDVKDCVLALPSSEWRWPSTYPIDLEVQSYTHLRVVTLENISSYDRADLDMPNLIKICIVLLDGLTTLRSLIQSGVDTVEEIHVEDCYDLTDVTVGIQVRRMTITRCDELTKLHTGRYLSLRVLRLQSLGTLDNLELADNIETLHLSHCPLLADIQLNPNLQTLSVTDCTRLRRINLQVIRHLRSLVLENLPSLDEVNLMACTALTTLRLQWMPQIHDLDLGPCTCLKELNIFSLGMIAMLWIPQTTINLVLTGLHHLKEILGVAEAISLQFVTLGVLPKLKGADLSNVEVLRYFDCWQCPLMNELYLPSSVYIMNLDTDAVASVVLHCNATVCLVLRLDNWLDDADSIRMISRGLRVARLELHDGRYSPSLTELADALLLVRNIQRLTVWMIEPTSNTVDGWFMKACHLDNPIGGNKDDLVWMDFFPF
jgi:hypothetical protein